MRKHLLATTLVGLASLSVLGAGVANAQPASHRAPQCFYTHDWDGWKASRDGHSIYIRVGMRKVYRLDFASACHEATYPNARLITNQRGSSSICNALDLDLRVSNGDGFASGCIVSDMTQLTDAEASALPKDLRP